jgi:hypothetical protein
MGVRILLIAVLGGLGGALAGCSAEAAPQRGSDVLVLELGGNHKPLRRTLRMEEPQRRLKVDRPGPERRPAAEPATRATQSARLSRPEPPRYREVQLRSGQSLYELCRLHLADPSRWREVMRLNGIAEEDLGRIPAGRMIRLPER